MALTPINRPVAVQDSGPVISQDMTLVSTQPPRVWVFQQEQEPRSLPFHVEAWADTMPASSLGTRDYPDTIHVDNNCDGVDGQWR